jgi:outer membrane autotransporter protein
VNTGDNSSNGLIIGAYKLNPQLRLGGYIDQNLSPSNLSPGIDLGNASPLFGVFGVWNDQADQLGYSVRVAAGYGDRDLSMTRQVIGTSEAGSGSTRLNSQAVSVEARYAMPMDPQWIATPYVGIRYTKINASAYTEQTTAAINNYPLSFNTLSQEYTTALAGLRVNGKVDSNFGIFAGAGIEQDLNNHGDNYSATGMTGLTAINLNPNLQKTRPVVNLGAFYDIDKTQRISFNAIYRQEAFQSTNTLTSLVTYTAGF